MDLRLTYLTLGARTVDLLASPEVADRWGAPSALEGLTIGGLAGHLARTGIWVVEEYLDAGTPVDDVMPTTAGRYYAELPQEREDPLHRAVAGRGEAVAAEGPDAVVERTREVLDRLSSRLPAEPPERRMAVIGGTVMMLDEYLRTRVTEILVHQDDLFVSIGEEESEPDPLALGVVLGVATDAAVARHGGRPVLRALFRRERQDLDIIRMF